MAQVLTSSWSDGSCGPIAFTVPEGAMKPDEIVSFNSEHSGEAMVLTSGSNTHFMCSDTLLQVYEQLLSPALEQQRGRLGVPIQTKKPNARDIAALTNIACCTFLRLFFVKPNRND